MQAHTKICRGARAICAAFGVSAVLFAQGLVTDPPNEFSGAGGQTVNGTYSVDCIESVNAINGNLGFRIPIGQLPPGPGGFTAGVNLIYNSAIYDLETSIEQGPILEIRYTGIAHGGGWTYGYKYTLWSQTRITNFVGQTGNYTCSAVQNNEAANWYKTVLTTPDGANHPLRLIGALNTNGTPSSVTLSSDTTQSTISTILRGIPISTAD